MPPPPDAFSDMGFPFAGLSLLGPFWDQKPVQMADGEWGRTTRQAVNVRGYEALAQRRRGGQRPGLSPYLPAPVVAGWTVQEINTLVGVGYPPPGGTVQASQSGRVVSLVAVSQGNVYVASAGATSWTAATNKTGNTPPLSYTGVVYSASINQKLWFADGTNWVYYNPADNTVNVWAPSAGQLPVDSKNNTPRLICGWRGRIVLAGLLLDPQQWFMSAVGDPTNFDYTGQSLVNQIQGLTVGSVTPTMAEAGGNSPVGVVPDVVTSLVPYNDDLLIFGGDHTIYQMTGDPLAGGQIDLITDSIGMAWGQPWCKGPDGTLFFFSNRTGIYALTPGQGPPVRISQQIEQLVNNIDTGANIIRLVWNDRFQGFHCFITPAAAQGSTTHLFWEKRTGAWWQDQFANTAHNPTCCCAFDGNLPTDRVVLLGGWDGFVRAVDPAATTDDGTAIASQVLLGPLVTKDLDDIMLKDLQAVLAETSGQVSYAVYAGPSAEKALALPAVATGTWNAGRNLNSYVRHAGHALYVQVSATTAWAMEQVRARIAGQGKVRRRGY